MTDLVFSWGPPHDQPENAYFERFFNEEFNCGIAAFKIKFSMLLQISQTHFGSNLNALIVSSRQNTTSKLRKRNLT